MEGKIEPNAPSGERSRSVAIYEWVQDRLPQSRGGKIAIAVAIGVLVMIPSVALLFIDLSEGRFATVGYAGVFLANLASTATVFIPVPGLTATAQTLINEQGANLDYPFLVGVLGGAGMALGEVTAYAAGAAGSEVAKESQFDVPRLVRPMVHRIVGWIDWLMERHGFATLLILSAIPNPTFELAGITAGAVRMNFWRFMTAVMIGKIARGLFLAYLGFFGVEIVDVLFFN